MFTNIINVISLFVAAFGGWIAWKAYINNKVVQNFGTSLDPNEYLEKCYDTTNSSDWAKNCYAQNFTRTPKIDHKILNRLIELDENNIIVYDDLLKKLKVGNPNIRYIKSDHVSFIRDIQYSSMLKSSYKFDKLVLGFMFCLGFFLLLIPIYEISKISLQHKELNFLEAFNVTCIFFEGIIIIYVSLYFKHILENAYLFVTLLHEAEVKFLKIKSPKKVKNPS